MNLSKHEVAIKAEPYIIQYRCELCGEGKMTFQNNASDRVRLVEGGPSLFKHQCDKCNGFMELPKIYPFVDYKPKGK